MEQTLSENQKLFVKVRTDLIFGELVAESPCSASIRISGRCRIGAFSYLGRGSEMWDSCIGRYCSIATQVIIGPTNHPTSWFSSHLFVFGSKGPFRNSEEFKRIVRKNPYKENARPTIIGNDVWIGRGAIIKRGVTVGDGAVIGAGAVVSKDVLPYEIVGGVPARHIRFRFSMHTIEQLLALQWWNYDLSAENLANVDFSDVEQTIELFQKLIEQGGLTIFTPQTVTLSSKTSDPGGAIPNSV